jgi:hypothetical protein
MQEEKQKAIESTIAMWKTQKEGVAAAVKLLRHGFFPSKVCHLYGDVVRFMDFLNGVADAQINLLEKEIKDGNKKIIDPSETNIVMP